MAGIIDAVVGGGGLISLPAYLAVGIPPHIATATNKCSSTFGTFLATVRYMKNGKIHYKSALYAAVTALIGSYFGAILNMSIDEKHLRYLLLAILPIISLFIIFKKDFGVSSRIEKMSEIKIKILSAVMGFFLGAYDGFFGPGTGTFLVIVFTGVIGFDLVTASGNSKIVNLASNTAAFITFAISGKIMWSIGLPAALFECMGNWIGSGLALKNGSKLIRPMFFITLGLLMCKILYNTFLI